MPAENNLVIGLLLALVLALAGDAGLGWLYLEARDARTAANDARDQAQTAATSCSRHTTELERDAAKRAAAGKKAATRAHGQALTHQAAGEQILASAPAVPGDACQSAGAAFDAWMKGRAGK